MTYELLGVGQVPAVATTLYTVPADREQALTLPLILLYNGHVAVVTTGLMIVRADGSTSVIDMVALASGAKREIELPALCLNAGDSIQMIATVAGVVSYTLVGGWQLPE